MKITVPAINGDWWVIPILGLVLGVGAFAGLLAEAAVAAALAAGLLVLVCYRSPGALLGWMVVAAPLITYRGPMDINPFRVLLGISLAVLALYAATRPEAFRPDAFLILGLAFLLKQCQSFAASEHLEFARKDLGLHFLGMTAMVSASLLIQIGKVRPRDLARFFLAGITLVVALNIYEIVQRSVFREYWVTLPFATVTVTEHHQIVPGIYRTHLPLSTPNHFGSYTAVALLVAAGMARARRVGAIGLRRRLWAILLLPPLAVSFLCTFSRTALISLFTGTAFLFGGKRGGRGLRAAAVSLIALLATFIVALVAASVVFGFDPEVFLARMTTRGMYGRGFLEHLRWKQMALRLWLENPILGAGLHDYGPYAGQPEGTSRAHSVYLTILTESGLLGLLLFILFLWCLYRMSARAIRLETDPADRILLCHFTAGFVGFLAASMFYDFFVDQEWWWLYLGILHGWYTLRLREIPSALPEEPALSPPSRPVSPQSAPNPF